MGKYNEKEKKWEAGDAIPKGLYGDIFKELGAKTVYVRITLRDDRRGIAQILVRQIGEKRGKQGDVNGTGARGASHLRPDDLAISALAVKIK